MDVVEGVDLLTFDLSSRSYSGIFPYVLQTILLHAALPPSLPPPPPIYRPPAMTRFSSLVAIAAVAVVTSDALVLNVDD